MRVRGGASVKRSNTAKRAPSRKRRRGCEQHTPLERHTPTHLAKLGAGRRAGRCLPCGATEVHQAQTRVVKADQGSSQLCQRCCSRCVIQELVVLAPLCVA